MPTDIIGSGARSARVRHGIGTINAALKVMNQSDAEAASHLLSMEAGIPDLGEILEDVGVNYLHARNSIVEACMDIIHACTPYQLELRVGNPWNLAHFNMVSAGPATTLQILLYDNKGVAVDPRPLFSVGDRFMLFDSSLVASEDNDRLFTVGVVDAASITTLEADCAAVGVGPGPDTSARIVKVWDVDDHWILPLVVDWVHVTTGAATGLASVETGPFSGEVIGCVYQEDGVAPLVGPFDIRWERGSTGIGIYEQLGVAGGTQSFAAFVPTSRDVVNDYVRIVIDDSAGAGVAGNLCCDVYTIVWRGHNLDMINS